MVLNVRFDKRVLKFCGFSQYDSYMEFIALTKFLAVGMLIDFNQSQRGDYLTVKHKSFQDLPLKRRLCSSVAKKVDVLLM